MANDVGVIAVVDAATGKRIWQERVDGVFSASPVAADGKIYFVSETGEVIVLGSGREPTILARNDIGERLIAGLAISNRSSSEGTTVCTALESRARSGVRSDSRPISLPLPDARRRACEWVPPGTGPRMATFSTGGGHSTQGGGLCDAG
jgi:hypothetical protein